MSKSSFPARCAGIMIILAMLSFGLAGCRINNINTTTTESAASSSTSTAASAPSTPSDSSDTKLAAPATISSPEDFANALLAAGWKPCTTSECQAALANVANMLVLSPTSMSWVDADSITGGGFQNYVAMVSGESGSIRDIQYVPSWDPNKPYTLFDQHGNNERDVDGVDAPRASDY